MKSQTYYTLMTSLPALRRFDRTERSPITRHQLEQRLRMLEPADALLLGKIESYLFWRRQPKQETEADLISQYRVLMNEEMPAVLKDFIEFWMSQRTILVGLRRRYQGQSAPSADQAWGVGRWTRTIREHWEEPHFQLSAVYPWVIKARELLEAGETLELERWMLDYCWKQLTIFALNKEFSYEAVVAYVLKWNLVDYWLSFDEKKACARFEKLVTEAYANYVRQVHV